MSQVVKTTSLKSKGMMSTCSKILIQINAKLGGISYKTIIDDVIKERDLMVVGVDSSHFNKYTAVAMVSTIDNSFADFYNKEKIIEIEKNEVLQFCMSSFLEEAVSQYHSINGKKPKNMIIYRQSLSDNMLSILNDEVIQIENFCKKNNILFYYILVNTRTTFKFLEKIKEQYCNPVAGLLVLVELQTKTNLNFIFNHNKLREEVPHLRDFMLPMEIWIFPR